jgi:hypothetical protein
MSSAPYYYVGSLEEVRRDLSGLPGIAYPDVSRYEGFGEATFSVHLYPGDRSIRSGYLIAYDYEQDKVHVRWNGTILSRIEIDGMSFEYFYGDMDFYTDGASLVGYRGARVYERVPMRFEREGPEGYGEYPDGRWVANLFFVVDTDDFVYRICASATLLPSEADPASFYGNIARAKGEAYAVIDSILDQREEPR